jgi:hypothetical protein
MPLLWELLDEEYDSEVRPHGDDDDDDDDSGGGGGGGDDDDSGDDDDDSGGGGDPGDQGDPGGGFDWGDNGDNGDQGGDNGDSGGGFDYGDNGGGDSGWSAVQDYEDNGRTIRKFTDSSGTDYFQDVGEWGGSSRNNDNSSSDFNWGDNNDQDNIFQDHGAREMPDVDPDVRDLHDYYHPYTISKYEDDPVRSKWGDGIASDGTRFDQQDEATQAMFGRAYGDTAPRSWAEQRSRDLEAEFRSRGVVTLPQQQQPIFRPQPPVTEAELPLPSRNSVGAGSLLDAVGNPPTNPDGSPRPYTVSGPAAPELDANGQPREYTPTSASRTSPAPETPEAEAASPQPQPPAPPAPPPGQQAAADAAARATASAGGSSQQVADAAAAAALAYDRRNLSSESLDTQRQFGQAYGDQANERWVQQHNQELALNRALYGTAEPRAGSPQTGQIPGLGDVGPAPDRTIGRAQPAPWNRPTTAAPGAAGVSSTPAPGLTPGAVSAVTSTTHGLIDDIVQRPAPPTTGALSQNAVSALTSTTHGLIDDILQQPAPGPSIDDSIRGAANIPNPNTGAVRGPTAPPPPLTGPQAAAYERGGVNPSTGDIDVQGTPGMPTQTISEAGVERTSDTSPIDASVRAAAGLPPAPDEQIEITEPIGNRHLLVPASRIGDFVGPGLGWQRVNPAPAPPPPPPPPPPAPAGPSIDASIRTAAGLPTEPNDNMGPREGDRSYSYALNGFDRIIDWNAKQQGATDVEGFGRNVAAGIAAGEAWAEPYAADMARLAWHAESRGLEGHAYLAPDSYVRDWLGAFHAGNTNVIGVKEASQELVSRGVVPPSVQASTAPSGPTVQTNLAKWTDPRTGVPGARIVPDQFTDPDVQGLPGWQKDAACGITTAVGAARSLGLNPSLGDALALARASGWTPGGGMNGTANEVALLRRIGVPAMEAEAADQRAVDAELAAGRPVALSGLKHIWLVTGKTDDGYVVSGSGTALAGGSAVMTKEKMERLMGPWRDMIRMDPAKLPQGGTRQDQPQTTMVSNPTPTTRMQPARASKVGLDGDPVGDTTGSAAADDTVKRVEGWHSLVTEAADEYGVPESVIKGIIDIESEGKPTAGSVQGATGLMQVMPRESGFPDRPTRQQLLDPRTNVRYGTKMLADLYKQHKDWDKASAAYFGALRNGQITDARDATGTTGREYVDRRKRRSALYR